VATVDLSRLIADMHHRGSAGIAGVAMSAIHGQRLWIGILQYKMTLWLIFILRSLRPKFEID
jgi:hypothetical protein